MKKKRVHRPRRQRTREIQHGDGEVRYFFSEAGFVAGGAVSALVSTLSCSSALSEWGSVYES